MDSIHKAVLWAAYHDRNSMLGTNRREGQWAQECSGSASTNHRWERIMQLSGEARPYSESSGIVSALL